MKRITSLLTRALPFVVSAAACSGEGAEDAADTAVAGRIAACDLIGRADAEAVTGPLTREPEARELTSLNATACFFLGENGALTLRVWHPYPGAESTSAALVDRLRSERADQAAAETDPDLKSFTANTAISSYDALGTPAALEDMRATIGSVTLHVMEPRADVYLAVDAGTPDIARAIAERALARLR